MEKILLAIDATLPDTNALEFACYLGRLTNSKVTGIFLENLEGDEKPVLKHEQGLNYVDWEVKKDSEEQLNKIALIEKNIAHFKEGCLSRDVGFSVHRDRGVPAREMIEESRYSDLLVVDAETSFNKRYEGTPTEFVRDILKNSECPVIIAPKNFGPINEIVFSYNGSSSSLFAIKQFTYLLPQFHNKMVSILQVNETGEWHDTDKYKFKEWLKGHYTDLQFEAIKGSPETKLFDHLFEKKNMFLVMGAYGRNALSQFFRSSHADMLIKTVSQPIFIAHM